MDDSSASLVIAFILLATHALITLAYAALVNTRESALQELADDGNQTAQRALKLLEQENRLALTHRLLTMILLSTTFVLMTINLLFPVMVVGDLLAFFALIALLVGGVVTFVLLGSVLPESIGSAHSQTVLPVAVFIFRWLSTLFYPVISLLLLISRLLARLFSAEDHVNMVTEEEIMTLVNAGLTGGTIETGEKAMIYSVLQMDETIARELMTPRPDIIALEVNTDTTDALHAILDSGFSRIPIYEENIDNVVGLLYAKDLLALWRDGQPAEQRPIRDLLRSPFFVPEVKRADELLHEMRVSQVHMAIVLDEYGGTSGLVTIEDLIEEIVGDIVDEYDVEEDEYRQISPTEYIVDAGMDLDDLNEILDIELDAEENDTLGGFIYMSLGRVPIVGDVVETDEVIMHVRSIDKRRIRNVALTLKTSPDEDNLPVQTDSDSSKPLVDAS